MKHEFKNKGVEELKENIDYVKLLRMVAGCKLFAATFNKLTTG